MNPAELVTPHLVEHCGVFKTIVICGFTKTGKVTIAKKLAQSLNRKLFISDDYLDQDNKADSLYRMMDDVLVEYNRGTPIIVEGILCFRLLRKGMQLNNFIPDLILKTECSETTIRHFYKMDREEHKIDRALSFNKGLNTIWTEYLGLLRSNPHIKRPNYLELNTSIDRT